jgi:hypothetical protein
MKYLSISNIYHRLKAESPTFFHKLRNIMVAMGTTGAALIAAQTMYPEHMEFIPTNIGGYLVTAGVMGTFLTSLTVKDPNENPKVN